MYLRPVSRPPLWTWPSFACPQYSYTWYQVPTSLSAPRSCYRIVGYVYISSVLGVWVTVQLLLHDTYGVVGRFLPVLPVKLPCSMASSFFCPTSLTTPNGLRLPGQQNRNVAFDPNKHHWRPRWVARYIDSAFPRCSFCQIAFCSTHHCLFFSTTSFQASISNTTLFFNDPL